PADDGAGSRPSIVSIQAEVNGLRSLVRVTLGNDSGEAIGNASGSIATTARHRLVANATVDALRRLDPAAECLDVEHAQVVRLGGDDGVAVEARKWAGALEKLGFEVRRLAGELTGPAGVGDAVLPGLALGTDAEPPKSAEIAAAIDGSDLVVVENICSLPVNP